MDSTAQKKLTANQMAILMQACANNGDESSIQKSYEELWEYFPKGYLTEQEFLEKFQDEKSFGTNSGLSPTKHLFSLIDRDQSGKIDLFEYLLGSILVNGQDPTFLLAYLFKIFDTDKNGLLTQAEVINVLNTFFSLIARKSDDGQQEKPDYSLEEITNDISNAFGDKTEITQQELLQVVEKIGECILQ